MNEDDTTFPIFLTEDELVYLVNTPLPTDLHCKIHDALGIMKGLVPE